MKIFVEIYKYFFVHKFMSYGRYYICTNYSISVGKNNRYGSIGILICKRENKFVIEYCSDDRIAVREYELV